jgi:uncharacterized protein YkwD
MPPRHRPSTALMLLAAAAGLLTGPLVQPAVASPSGAYEHTVQRHTNAERTQRDRKALTKSACLDGYAEKQARAMAGQQQMFHQQLGPILAECNLSQVGENVAFGYPSGQAVVSAWLASPGHRSNLLNSRHRLIGVGAYQDVDGHWYVSQVLGRSA